MSVLNPRVTKNQLIQLSSQDNAAASLFFCSELDPAQTNESGQVVTWEEGIRTGHFSSPVYGDFDVTLTDLYQFVKNFHAGTAGQKILFDYEHQKQRGHGTPFEVINMKVEGSRLLVQAQWTPAGRKAVKEQGFRYLSLEFHPNFTDNEKRGPFGPTVVGGAITIRPFVKRMQAIDPHKLSESPQQAAPVVFYNHKMESSNMKDLQTLKNYLAGLVSGGKLTKALSEQLLSLGVKLCESAGEDKAAIAIACSDVQSQADSLVVQLAEGAQTLNITLTEPKPVAKPAEDAKALTSDDVAGLVAKVLSDRDAAIQATQTTAATNKAALVKALSEIPEITDAEKTQALKLAEPILANVVTAEGLAGVVSLAKNGGEQLVAMRKLTDGGFGGQGMAAGGEGAIGGAGVEVQKIIDTNLTTTSLGRQNKLQLSESNGHAAIVLAQFDAIHGATLEQERLALSEGTDLSNTNLPAALQRTVIREALADTKVLDLVAFDYKASTGTTVTFPYEVREGTLTNYGITAEGQGMQVIGVGQKMDSMVLIARKVAMMLSNEVIHFSKASLINWDAMARAIVSNAEVMKETLAAWIMNSLVRYADAFEAVDVAGEDIAAQLDGSSGLIKLAKFPLVQAFQQVDIQGAAVGSEENPIVLTVSSAVIKPWGPKVTAGTYYRVEDYTLGLIRLVTETGAEKNTTSSSATISYSHATNCEMLNEDDYASTTDTKERLDNLLDSIGDQRAFMGDTRFVNLDFMLSSETFNNMLSKAKGYVKDVRNEDKKLSAIGDAAGTKGLPFFKTNRYAALGQQRCLLGVRGAMSVMLTKPYGIDSGPIEVMDPTTGTPTGQKMFYGEEYIGLKVPKLLAGYYRTVGWYSVAKRNAMG
jgi:hypothetical protein